MKVPNCVAYISIFYVAENSAPMSRKRQQSHGFFWSPKISVGEIPVVQKQVHDQISRLALRSQHWMMGKLEPETPHISW